MFETSKSSDLKPLSEIVDELEEDGTVYYLGGASLDELKRSPYLESATDKEVLFLHGPVDLLSVESLMEFKGRKFANLAAETSDENMSDEDKKIRDDAEKEHSDLITSMKEILGDKVADVRFSPKLRETPCILVAGKGDPGEMMKMMMRAMNQDAPDAKKVLELNPAHPVVTSLEALNTDKKPTELFKSRVEMLLELARVFSGTKPEDPAKFGKFVAELMG